MEDVVPCGSKSAAPEGEITSDIVVMVVSSRVYLSSISGVGSDLTDTTISVSFSP